MDFKVFLYLNLHLLAVTGTEYSLSDMAAFVANSVYRPHQVTSVVWWRSDPEDVTYFLQNFNGAVVTAPIKNSNNHKTRELNKAVGYKQTVLFAISTEEFAYFMTIVNLDLVIPIRIVLVLTKPTTNIFEITRTAWNNDLADIIIVSKNEEGNVTLSTYFPYRKGICGDYSPVKLDLKTMEIFPKKFKSFHGCPIKATLLHFLPYVKLERNNGTVTSITGIDGSFFMFIIERINASLDIVSSTDHGGMGLYINNSGTGSFGDLVNRRADIFTPAAIINHQRYPVAQISHVYETLDVYWCAPNRREIQAWAKVLLPFFTSTTPFLCLTFVVFIVVTMIFKRCKLHRTVFKDSVLFYAFMVFLGQEVKFETRSSLINSLFIMWIWFCLIIRIGYQGDLVDGLQKKILEPHLASVEEAVEAVDGYGGVEVFREYYRGTPLEKNYKVLPLIDIPPYIRDISNGKRFLLATDILLVRQFRRIVQVLDEPVTRAATCLFMRPGWPAAKEVDLLIHHAIEAGFIEKILHDNRHEWLINGEPNEVSQEDKPLDMSILGACFYGLIVLWLICFIVFIIENIHYRIKQKRAKLN